MATANHSILQQTADAIPRQTAGAIVKQTADLIVKGNIGFHQRPSIRLAKSSNNTKETHAIIKTISRATSDPNNSSRVELNGAVKAFRSSPSQTVLKMQNNSFMTNLVNTFMLLQGSIETLDWLISIPADHPYLKWDEPCVNRLLVCLARDGHFENAANFMENLTLKRLRVYEKTLNCILGEMVKNSPLQVSDFFNRVEKSGQKIHLSTLNWMVHNTLVPYARRVGCYKSGQGDGKTLKIQNMQQVQIEAERYIKMMQDAGYIPDTWTKNSFLTFYANNNQLEKAKALLDEMENEGPMPNIKSYGIILNSYFKSKKYQLARDLLSRIKNLGLEFDKIMYTICIDGFKKAGKFEEVELYYNEMVEKGFKPSFYDYVSRIDMNCRIGNICKATSVFNEFLSMGHQPNEIILSLFIKGHAVNNDIEGAISVFREMKNYGIGNTVISYNNLIGYLVKQCHYREALDLRAEMKEFGIQADRFTSYSIIHAYSMTGNETEMLLAFEAHVDAGYPISSYALNSLVSYYARNRESKKALKIADYLSEITSKRPWLNPIPQYTIAHFIQPLKQHQKTEEVLKFLGKQPKQDWNFVVLDIFIRALEDVGDCEGIIEAFWNSLKNGLVPDLRLYTSYIKIMRRQGIKEECEKAYKHLIDSGFEPNEQIEKAMGKINHSPTAIEKID